MQLYLKLTVLRTIVALSTLHASCIAMERSYDEMIFGDPLGGQSLPVLRRCASHPTRFDPFEAELAARSLRACRWVFGQTQSDRGEAIEPASSPLAHDSSPYGPSVQHVLSYEDEGEPVPPPDDIPQTPPEPTPQTMQTGRQRPPLQQLLLSLRGQQPGEVTPHKPPIPSYCQFNSPPLEKESSQDGQDLS